MKEKVTLRELFSGPAKNTYVEFFRSLFVGGAAFVSDYILMVLLKEKAGMGAVLSATLSFVVGVAVNYLLSNFWAFRESNVKNQALRFLIFTAIATVGLLLTDLIVWAFDVPFAESRLFGMLLKPEYYYMAGKIVATVAVFFWNFFSRKRILYSRKANNEGTTLAACEVSGGNEPKQRPENEVNGEGGTGNIAGGGD